MPEVRPEVILAPMQVDVVLLPALLSPQQLNGRSVVVFDVLRATTTMTAALAAGVAAIEVHASIESARRAAAAFQGLRILCGEVKCLPPEGFDLGNSPRQFGAEHAGAYMFLSTTNGTKAIVAARGAARMYAGALVNAATVAGRLVSDGAPVTLLCAGTEDRPAMCDLLGAGAVISELAQIGPIELAGDAARMAVRQYGQARPDLVSALRESQGGLNLRRVGLDADIEFAAKLNTLEVLGKIVEAPLRVVKG